MVEIGGVGILELAGGGPVGQTGRCLFGIGVWLFTAELLKERGEVRGGGVEECGTGCCWTTIVAIVECYCFSGTVASD